METKDSSLIKTELIIKIFNLLRDSELTIEEAQDIIEIIEADLYAEYSTKIFIALLNHKDIGNLKVSYLKDYKFLNDFETRLIDYIDKNYKPNKRSEVKKYGK